jgi:hypothetical protein
MVKLHEQELADPVGFVVCVVERAVMVTRENHRVTVFETGRIVSERHPAGAPANCWVAASKSDVAGLRLALVVRALLLPDLPPLPGQPVLVEVITR